MLWVGARFFLRQGLSQRGSSLFASRRVWYRVLFGRSKSAVACSHAVDASRFSKLTLIREQRVGTDAPEQPWLQLEDLPGEWRGQKVRQYFVKEDVDRQLSNFWLVQQGKEFVQQTNETGRSTSCKDLQGRAQSSAFEFEGQVYHLSPALKRAIKI